MMASNRKQYFGIKYPFTSENTQGFFVDLNNDANDKIASEIVHVVLTPKRTRIRMPDFGTDLAKWIFEPNDSMTWEKVKAEVVDAVSKYVPDTVLDDISVEMPDDNSIYLDIRYSVSNGETTENNRLGVKLI